MLNDQWIRRFVYSKTSFPQLERTIHERQKIVLLYIVKTLKAHYPTLEEPIDLGNFIENEKINIILDNIKNNYISHWKQQITNSTKL
jgi:hypothetical protein